MINFLPFLLSDTNNSGSGVTVESVTLIEPDFTVSVSSDSIQVTLDDAIVIAIGD